MGADPFNLQRFVDAQEAVYTSAFAELSTGRKITHWMWFIFPQLAALGRSGTARFYGLANAEHAHAYWGHPTLGPRLKKSSQLVLSVEERTAHHIFGSPDDLKLCSCMTLFETAIPEEAVFGQVLARFYGGARDALTLAHLKRD